MFDGEEDESEWMIDDTNAIELIEALNYQHNDMLTEDELLQIVEKDLEDTNEGNKI